MGDSFPLDSPKSITVRTNEVIQIRIFKARRAHDATTPRIETALIPVCT